jgi:hypothetical protein
VEGAALMSVRDGVLIVVVLVVVLILLRVFGVI